MPYREETWTEITAGRAYPDLDNSQPGDIAVIGLPGADPVGYLVRQEEALEWFTNVDAQDEWRGAIRQAIEDSLDLGLARDWRAADAWVFIVNNYPVSEVRVDQILPEFYQQLRVSWDVPPAE